MQQAPNFFSDPKVIISLISLFFSMASLIWTLANQFEQNRRWEELNNANPELKEASMIIGKEVTYEEAQSTNWGYDPMIFSKGEAFDTYILPYRLIARDSANNTVEGLNRVFTISALDNELERTKYNGGKVSVTKLFRPKFVFENMGKTDAKDLSIKVDARLQGQEWQNAFTSNAKINLAGGQLTNISFGFELPINSSSISQVDFKIFLKFYDVNNKLVEKTINAKWTTIDNYWSYASDSE